MREYRAWDKIKKEMIYVNYESFKNGYSLLIAKNKWVISYYYYDSLLPEKEIILKSENGILIESIGLKDKNNKMIFVDDIITYKGSGWHREDIGRIIFDYDRYCIKPIKAEIMCNTGLHDKKIKIIGNKYQNKDLVYG